MTGQSGDVPDAGLPQVPTAQAFDQVRRDERRLRPGVVALCRRLGLGRATVTRFTGGSLPVYAVGDRLVLKLYPPSAREHGSTEHRVLQAVDGRLPVPTPRVEAYGRSGAWSYLLMTRLGGEPLTEVWPRTAERDRDRLAAQLGATLAALHTLTVPGLGARDWAGFLAAQRAGCVARQRSRGLPEHWAAQIPDFLDSVPLPDGPLVLLHTEVMGEHLHAVSGPAGWSLSGLLDFEPAMMGAREYEFAATGLYVSRGDARFLRRLLLAYGLPRDRLDARLRRRFLACTLLHRYSDLPGYLKELPAPSEPTLEALADHWWRLD